MNIEVRDKKKVSDLLRLVDRLRQQLKEGEEHMKRLQALTYKQTDSRNNLAGDTVDALENSKAQRLQIKHDELQN